MLYVGMDISYGSCGHKNYSSVAVIDEGGDLVDRRRVNHRYREELTGYFNQFPLKTSEFGSQLSQMTCGQVVMEATCVDTKYKSDTPQGGR